MWLLRAKEATLEHFVSPEHVPPHRYRTGCRAYAILSHVWGKKEQTFQDIQALPFKCAPGQTPRDIASEKIRKACELAEEKGYEWIWIDTCCIDKSSSTELSEAINSMFRYYSLAGECFAYLEDVSSDDGPMPAVQFKKSKWHTRGWTLQELIAPQQVTFLSSSWTYMGRKSYNARVVEEATGVPVDVLRFQMQMKEFSIAQRMSWAARRVTTREEDEAYCLLGIFDINMPPLYGEGRKAFRRLQEEIMRQSPDTTLFAWGPRCTWDELAHLRVEDPASCEDPDYHLFATSPSSFRECSQLRFVNPMKCLRQLSGTEHGYISFTSTPHGVSTEIPIITHEEQRLGHLGWVEERTFLLLPLQPLLSGEDKVHRIGVPLVGAGQIHFPHVVYAPTSLNDAMLQKSATADWSKVYLAYDSVAPTTKAGDTSVFHSVFPVPERPSFAQFYSPFHFDPRHLAQHPMLALGSHSSGSLEHHVTWTGDPPLTLPVDVSSSDSGSKRKVASLYIRLGICTRSSPVPGSQQVTHWARLAVPYRLGNVPEELRVEHDCSDDHISSWPRRARTFGCKDTASSRFQVTLSFTPFERDQKRTLVLRLDAKRVDAFDNDCIYKVV
ncbi:heterokaryon incompatibility protein-domain-containing protein [Fomes fomentarius]|nr:heterokaryon incompatibility protein-domain-containing protein [Fomes fomentarius]